MSSIIIITANVLRYYTLHSLYYFLRNADVDHSAYARDAIGKNIVVVRKQGPIVKNRSSRIIDSQRLFSREKDFPKDLFSY